MEEFQARVRVFEGPPSQDCLHLLQDRPREPLPPVLLLRATPPLPHDGQEQEGRAATQPLLQRAVQQWRAVGPVLGALFPGEYPLGVVHSPLQDLSETVAPWMPPVAAGSNTHLIKRDDELPVAGSIKARGGIYEVLWYAQQVAEKEGLAFPGADGEPVTPAQLEALRTLCSQYRLSVGSTGNLGLSIGLVGAALGFQVTVHMSVDAKQWKKDRLRKHHVQVVEHEADYSQAVAQGRAEAEADPRCHFVDDETSLHLFEGYSAAALELQQQLQEMDIPVDEKHPLFVYLPCGVGGAPGGVAAGLHALFGSAVKCFWAEPTGACCGLLGLLSQSAQDQPSSTEGGDPILSMYDVGRCVDTVADGLACPVISELALRLAGPHLAGCFAIPDADILRMHLLAIEKFNLRIEPSSAVAFFGPMCVAAAAIAGKGEDSPTAATHVYWMTGGSLIPEPHFGEMIDAARAASEPLHGGKDH